MTSYVAPHRYETRFQAKKRQSLHSDYMRNMSHVNLLYTKTQTTHDMDRIYALTELYLFLQEFQPWKDSDCLRAAMERKINHLLMVEIPIEWKNTSHHEKEDALFELEHTLFRLQCKMI
jgi:hypothetical protein